MLHSTRISTARSLPRQRTATANSAGPQSSSCLSPQMPFHPGFVCIPPLKTSWKSIVPSLHGQWVLPAKAWAPLCPAASTGAGLGRAFSHAGGASRQIPGTEPQLLVPADCWSSQPVPADQQMIQGFSPTEVCWGNEGQDTRYLYHFWLIFVDECCKYEARRFKRKSLTHESELICF